MDDLRRDRGCRRRDHEPRRREPKPHSRRRDGLPGKDAGAPPARRRVRAGDRYLRRARRRTGLRPRPGRPAPPRAGHGSSPSATSRSPTAASPPSSPCSICSPGPPTDPDRNGDGERMRRVLLPLSPEYIGYADIGLVPGMLTVVPLDDHRARRQALQVRGGFRRRGGGRGCRRDLRVATHQPHRQRGDGRRAGPARGPSPVPAACRSSWTTPTGFPFPAIVHGEATPTWDENTVLCMSLSKLGLPGLRTGIVIANEEIIAALAADQRHLLSRAGKPRSRGRQRISSGGGDVLALARDVIRPHYAERAERAVDILREGLEGCDIRIHRPEGAFFLWLWTPGLPITNAVLYERLKARECHRRLGPAFLPGARGRRLAAQARVHPHQLRGRLEPYRARPRDHRRGGAPRLRRRLTATDPIATDPTSGSSGSVFSIRSTSRGATSCRLGVIAPVPNRSANPRPSTFPAPCDS